MLEKAIETIKELSLLEEVKNVPAMSEEEQLAWLDKSGSYLKQFEELENATIMGQAAILYNVYELWDKDKLKKEVKAHYAYDFYKWAKKFTQKRAKEPSEQTINNKITVYRDWVAEEHIPYPPKVYLPKRDNLGHIIEAKDESDWIETEFDPMNTDYGKLLIARGRARKGDLTEDAWAAIMDPYATSRELKNFLISDEQLEKAEQNGKHNPNLTESSNLEIYESEGILYAQDSGEATAICTFNTENSDNPTYKKAVALILQMFGLKPSPSLFEEPAVFEVIK